MLSLYIYIPCLGQFSKNKHLKTYLLIYLLMTSKVLDDQQ